MTGRPERRGDSQAEPSGDAAGGGPPVALVTGASSGIGRATALALARRGVDLVVHARRMRPEFQQVIDQIESCGRQAQPLLADFAERAQVEQLADQAWNWRGYIDILVNNAGADVLTGAAAQWPLGEKLDLLWRVDVAATWTLSRQIGRRMVQRLGAAPADNPPPRTAAILNVGWDQAWQGMAGDSGELFSISKGAVMALSLSLAQSLAPWVRVNCVAPGWIQTAWGRQASEPWSRRARAQSLAGRWGTAAEVAEVIAFLASDQASFISGQVIDVNGGFRYWPNDQT